MWAGRVGGGPVQRADEAGVAGHGQVVRVAGCDVEDPDWHAVGADDGLDVPAGARCFPEYHALIVSPFTLVVVSAQSARISLPSTTTCDQPCSATSGKA